jgi:hypothetical protein
MFAVVSLPIKLCNILRAYAGWVTMFVHKKGVVMWRVLGPFVSVVSMRLSSIQRGRSIRCAPEFAPLRSLLACGLSLRSSSGAFSSARY